ncbi:MAG: cytochrome P450 [Ktedonobacteraceae bacterium]|nr:cytochrome P450 [Ktedonobacteraceae bacterium]
MATIVKDEHEKSIPAIRHLPIVGNLPEFRRDRLGLFLRVARECGDIGMLHFGPFPGILINSPELVHSVLVEHAYDFDKGEFQHNAFRPTLGNGLLISEGEYHRQQRKLIAPSFQPRNIIAYAAAMGAYGEQLQSEWADGAIVDIGHEMTRVTMSIVGKVLFDTDVFTEADELGAAMTTILEHINHTLSKLFPVPFSWPTPHNFRAKRAIAVLRSRIQQMIDERRTSSQERNDFLSILLNAQGEDGSHMTNEQIGDEALILFAAGHETTATALTWAWYVLATHPDIYEKMQQEVDTVLQGRTPTYSDLAQLPYTLQVFKETMRLYPPAYGFVRVALRDQKIVGYSISKGQTVIISPYTMHRNAGYFSDPETFDPERFAPENEKKLPRLAYMPFGAGPRICIGNHFAMMEGHLLLATFAQRVIFELMPGQHVIPDPGKTVTIRPRHHLMMRVKHRNVTV